MKDKEFDFFISHASEDKASFVRPLAEKLSTIGYNVWYDEFSLKLGDSLVQGISNGIKKSTFGIIVLSKNFFKKTWTRKELDALLNKEVIINSDLILPIWLDITQNDVYEFFPLLIDKLAITAKEGEIMKVISEIERKTEIHITSVRMLEEKIDFLKFCNNDERSKYLLDLEFRVKNLFFYHQELYNWHTSENAFGDKEGDDLLIESKDNELRKKYRIPVRVWHGSKEQHPGPEMNRVLQLCKKWVNRGLTSKDAGELYFLMDEYMDTDLHFILYGFPYGSINNPQTFKKSISGIYEVGMKKIPSEEEKHKSFLMAFENYYSQD